MNRPPGSRAEVARPVLLALEVVAPAAAKPPSVFWWAVSQSRPALALALRPVAARAWAARAVASVSAVQVGCPKAIGKPPSAHWAAARKSTAEAGAPPGVRWRAIRARD